MSDSNQLKEKKNFTEKVSDAVIPIAEKMQASLFIGALSQTVQLIMPIIIIGSFACLFAFVGIGPWQAFLTKYPVVQFIFMRIQSLTLSLFALYVVIILPYMYATKLKMEQALATVPVTLAAFLLLTPTELYASIPAEWLGHKGLLSAFLISFIVVRITKFLIDKNIRIKMPAGVPKFVEDAFTVLIPAASVAISFVILGQMFTNTPLGTFHQLIYSMVQTPIRTIGLSLVGQTVADTFAALLMFCGIHPGVIHNLVEPLRLAAAAEQLAAWQAGLPLPHIVVHGFTNLSLIGAGGSALSATLAVIIFSKSKRYKSIGRIALVPGIFGIGEPILFGLPIMLNPMFFIPFIFVAFFNQVFVYFLIYTGLVGRFTGVIVHWTMPPIINVILSSSTPVRAVIAQLVVIAINLAIWFPFIRAADKLVVKEEAAAANK